MNSLSSSKSEDQVLSDLLDYCTMHQISISQSVSLRRVPGKGLGVYVTQPLHAGDRIMHVPTPALFTTSSIPTSFLGREARRGVPVHALLAAYLAFGMSEAERDRQARWMATWPRLTDFTTTLPMFWPVSSRLSVMMPSEGPVNSQGGSVANGTSSRILPPSLTGSWIPENSHSTGEKPLDIQLAKLRSHLEKVAQRFPQHSALLLSPTTSLHWSFVHAWCGVNSRCFYHLRPGQRPPQDSCEAMALCPGMDLFNHTDTDRAGCKTTYDRKGYYVSAQRDFGAGEEVLLNYGALGNDALWTEYGFVMEDNHADAVSLDEIVLDRLTEAQKQTLAQAGYLGEYWLKADGVCWRTEVASWLGILSHGQWLRFIEGKLDPNKLKGHAVAQKDQSSRTRNGNTPTNGRAHAVEDSPVLLAAGKQIAWIARVAAQAEESLRVLMALGGSHSSDTGHLDELMEIFADNDKVLLAQGVERAEISAFRSSQADARLRMCVHRWWQIWILCHDTITNIQDTCPGAPSGENYNKTANQEEGKRKLEQQVHGLLNRSRPV